jgi:hypothetical protein
MRMPLKRLEPGSAWISRLDGHRLVGLRLGFCVQRIQTSECGAVGSHLRLLSLLKELDLRHGAAGMHTAPQGLNPLKRVREQFEAMVPANGANGDRHRSLSIGSEHLQPHCVVHTAPELLGQALKQQDMTRQEQNRPLR